jgi:hypothetical protein
VLDHPWRNLVCCCDWLRWPTPTGGARGPDRREHSYRGCDKK